MAENRPAARAAATDTFVPSVLDRLTAPESAGSGPSLGFRLADLIEAVRHDLEDLLNTRQTHQGLPPEFEALGESILAYGLPDFSRLEPVRGQAHRQLGGLVEAIVNRYEPRLRDVRAIPVEESSDNRQGLSVRIHIEARLRVEPYPDVSFESVIELASGHTSIRSEGA